MAVTIDAISPVIGHSGGKTMVTIDGSGFRLPTILDSVNGLTPEPTASVCVTFGGVPAERVDVASSGRLYVITAIGDVSDAPVDVVVTNLDASGDPIPGESATQASAWRYVRPSITDGRSDLVRVIDTFVEEMQRQVLANTVWPQNTDFDPDTSDTLSEIDLPSFPGMVIAATEIEDNDFYAERSRIEVDIPGDSEGGFQTLDPPDTVDIVFTIVGASDNKKELLNLSAAVRRFFKKNPYLRMARDPDDASKGTVSYELRGTDAKRVKVTVSGSADNVGTFAFSARIVGFQIESMVIANPDNPEETVPGEGVNEVSKTMADDGLRLSVVRR